MLNAIILAVLLAFPFTSISEVRPYITDFREGECKTGPVANFTIVKDKIVYDVFVGQNGKVGIGAFGEQDDLRPASIQEGVIKGDKIILNPPKPYIGQTPCGYIDAVEAENVPR